MRHFLSIVAIAGCSMYATLALGAPPDQWTYQRLPEAFATAKASNKPIYLQFGFEACGGCKALYRNAYSDSDLRDAMHKDFVVAYLDTEGTDEPASYTFPDGSVITHNDLISQFKAAPTPSWIFLSPKGDRLEGSGRGGRTFPRELMRDAGKALESMKDVAASK